MVKKRKLSHPTLVMIKETSHKPERGMSHFILVLQKIALKQCSTLVAAVENNRTFDAIKGVCHFTGTSLPPGASYLV